MTGDRDDIAARLRSFLPPWFADESPVLASLLLGLATALAFVYGFIVYATLQTRIRTATGGWLDLISQDFFGTELPRKGGQSDTSYRAQIIANLFRERATRAGMVRVLTDLTGVAPLIFEPRRPRDTGAYGGPLGYGRAGGYGSLLLPFQCFVTAFRPAGQGIANVAGYGISTAGYSTPSQGEYASIDMVTKTVTDQDIYDAIDRTKPVATIIWTRIATA